MKVLVFVISLFLSISLWGQTATSDLAENLPDSPSVSKLLAEQQAGGSGTPVKIESASRSTPSPANNPTEPALRTLDRTFVLASVFQVGATIANVEALEYKISQGNGPGDSPYGKPPSRALLYGMAIPISSSTVAWSYYIKKKYPNSRAWLLIPAMVGGIQLSTASDRFASAK